MQNVYDEDIMHALTELFPISYGLSVRPPLFLPPSMNLSIMAVRVLRNLSDWQCSSSFSNLSSSFSFLNTRVRLFVRFGLFRQRPSQSQIIRTRLSLFSSCEESSSCRSRSPSSSCACCRGLCRCRRSRGRWARGRRRGWAPAG